MIPVLLGAVAYGAGLRWARTPSLPPGIYRLTDNPSDPLISFCPVGESSRESSERGYRDRSWACPDHHAPLLKPVVAREGDTVTISSAGISVNGHLLPNSRAYPFDGQRRPMHIWPSGLYTVARGTVWVVSTYNKASYDSRYYGPVAVQNIIHYGHPFWQY